MVAETRRIGYHAHMEKTKPMEIQEKAIAFGLQKKTWGLFSEMGTGKTLTALYWARRSGLRCVAVIGRKDDLDTWAREIEQHTNATYQNICLKKGRKKRREALKQYEAGATMFCLMTYDSVKQLENELHDIAWDGVIADEFTEIKHPNTKRTRAIQSVFGHIPNRLGMTGTPVTNSPEDLFSQMRFIDGGKRLGTNLWKFRIRYFWPEPHGHKWHLFPRSKAKLHELMREVAIRFKKEDALDLPPKVFLRQSVELHPQQLALYNQVKNEYELTLQSGEIWEFTHAIQQFTKMLQITGGFYYAPALHCIPKEAIDLPSAKLDRLKWTLDREEFRQTPKIVIWAAFNHELEKIRDAAAELGYHGVVFWKHTPDRQAARLKFQDDPACQLFIGQVASGIGMNELKVSDTVFYYSRSLKLVHRLQSEDRTHRKGSERHKHIRYFDLIAKGTVDEKVYKMLRQYKDIAAEIVDGRTASALLSSE